MAKAQPAYIGIDLGGTNIQAGVLGGDGKLLARGSVKTKAEGGSKVVIRRIAELVDEVIGESKVRRSKIGGLGIGAPGAIDITRGVVMEAVNLRWNNFPLARELGKATGLAVTVDNDVNVGAWGEQQMGAARGQADMLGIFVGTGIGSGLVLGGQLYHGRMMTAGEIGHEVIRADAPLGRRTLENVASRTAVVNLLTQLIQSNHKSLLVELTDGDLTKIRSKVLAEALARKDELTMSVVRQAATYVGIAAANAVTLLSLPCVVIGGGMASALGKPYLDWVRQSFMERVFPRKLRTCKVVLTRLHDDAGVVGAALLARQRLTDNLAPAKKK